MLPIVMPTNLRKLAQTLETEFPNRLGLLLSPEGWTNPKGLPYALDNGRFPCWSKGKKWNEELFFQNIKKAQGTKHNPLWIVVPDVVANCEETFKEWKQWTPSLKKYGWPLAMAVQDKMTPEQVRKIRPRPDIIFVGGTTRWKWKSLTQWTRNFPRVHVGRVNTIGLLWRSHECGAESTDGTGWWHHKQKEQLIEYLKRSSKGLGRHDDRTFFPTDRYL